MLGARRGLVPAARRSLPILPQIWETMIRMSRTDCRVVWTICGFVLGIAGCCGGGPNHKWDFTPRPGSEFDGGSAGPTPCGPELSGRPQVCCLKKAAPGRLGI